MCVVYIYSAPKIILPDSAQLIFFFFLKTEKLEILETTIFYCKNFSTISTETVATQQHKYPRRNAKRQYIKGF